MIHSAGDDKAATEKLQISIFKSFMTPNIRVYRFVIDSVDSQTVPSSLNIKKAPMILRKDGVHDYNTEPSHVQTVSN